MKKLKDAKIEFKYGYYVIAGECYEEGHKDGKPYLKHINKKEVKENIDLADKIADKLKDKLDTYKVLMESIMKMSVKDIKKLHGMLYETKKEYNVQTREHRCVDMKVGNFILPIVN